MSTDNPACRAIMFAVFQAIQTTKSLFYPTLMSNPSGTALNTREWTIRVLIHTCTCLVCPLAPLTPFWMKTRARMLFTYLHLTL